MTAEPQAGNSTSVTVRCGACMARRPQHRPPATAELEPMLGWGGKWDVVLLSRETHLARLRRQHRRSGHEDEARIPMQLLLSRVTKAGSHLPRMPAWGHVVEIPCRSCGHRPRETFRRLCRLADEAAQQGRRTVYL